MSGLVLSVYNAVSELPSGAANGTMAWIAGSTNRLYISNGTAWYSTSAFSNVALSTYTLAGDYHHTALTKADLNWVVSNDYLNGISIDPNNNSIIIPGLETSTSGYKPAIWKLNNPSSGLPSLSWSSVLTVNYGNDPMSASDTDADGNIYYVYTGKTSDGTSSGGIFAKVSPTGSLIWERLIYDSAYAVSNGDSRMLVETIQIDKENNIAVIGCRDNDLTASLIQKWDISQTTPSITWSRKLKYGTPLYSGQFHRAIIDNNGNIYTTGVSSRRELDSGVPNPRQDVFVTKHSSDGTLLWQKHYCTSETPVIAVRGFATDSENNLILAGYGYVYDGGSQSDRDWLLKLDADGNILWQRHIGQDTDGTTTVDNTTRLGSVRNILVDADDFIIVVGGSHRIGFFDPYGELIRSLEFSPIIGTDPGLILDNNNNLVIVSKIGAGSAPTTGDPYSSLGIYVLPSNSQLIQTGTYNDTGNSLGIDVTISEYNDLVIYSNGADFEVNNGIATVTSITAATTTTGTTRTSGSGYQVYNTALPPYGPVITGVTDASAGTTPFTLATDGTPTVITVAATDADGDPLTYSYSVSSGTLGNTATVSQADNVFTITPSTTEADAGTFGLTFSVNDGDQTTTSVANFTLSFVDPWYGDRALFAGGTGSVTTSNIDYFSISTVGSVTKFGDLVSQRYYMASSGLSDSTYCLFLGGSDGNNRVDSIEYVTASVPSASTTDFGNLSSGSMDGTSGVSDATYGLHLTGYLHPNYINTIDYVTIAVPTATASDFGDATDTQHARGGGTNDSTRGVFIGGYGTAGAGTTDYVTIATPGTAQNFGNLINNNYDCSACSNNVIGVVGGGSNSSTFAQLSALDYITIQTLGSTTNAGDLTVARHKISACSNGSIGVWAGGNDSSPYNTIDYLTLSTTGNATDYGDLTVGGYGGQATSGSPA